MLDKAQFIKYCISGLAFASAVTFLSWLLIDLRGCKAVIIVPILSGGFFILKFFIFKHWIFNRPKIRETEGWAIVESKQNGRPMHIGHQPPVFWSKTIAEKENRKGFNGEIIPCKIITKKNENI